MIVAKSLAVSGPVRELAELRDCPGVFFVTHRIGGQQRVVLVQHTMSVFRDAQLWWHDASGSILKEIEIYVLYVDKIDESDALEKLADRLRGALSQEVELLPNKAGLKRSSDYGNRKKQMPSIQLSETAKENLQRNNALSCSSTLGETLAS